MRELVNDFLIRWDSGDQWGSTMGYFFEVAHELSRMGADIPEAWQYRDGAAGPPERDGDYPEIYAAGSSELVMFGNLLHILSDTLRDAGKDY